MVDVEEYVPDDDDDEAYIIAAEAEKQIERRQNLEQPQVTAYGIAASQVNLTSNITDPSFDAWAQQGEMHGRGRLHRAGRVDSCSHIFHRARSSRRCWGAEEGLQRRHLFSSSCRPSDEPHSQAPPAG